MIDGDILKGVGDAGDEVVLADQARRCGHWETPFDPLGAPTNLLVPQVQGERRSSCRRARRSRRPVRGKNALGLFDDRLSGPKAAPMSIVTRS
jgi:hypothetical protein